MVELNSLQNGEEVEEWHQLTGITPVGEWGAVRLRYRYLQDFSLVEWGWSVFLCFEYCVCLPIIDLLLFFIIFFFFKDCWCLFPFLQIFNLTEMYMLHFSDYFSLYKLLLYKKGIKSFSLNVVTIFLSHSIFFLVLIKGTVCRKA